MCGAWRISAHSRATTCARALVRWIGPSWPSATLTNVPLILVVS